MSFRVEAKAYLGLLVACGCNAIFGIEKPTRDESATDAGQAGTDASSGGVSNGGRGGASSGGVSNGAGGTSEESAGMAGETSGGAGDGGASTGGATNATGGASSLGGSTSTTGGASSLGGVTGSGGTIAGRGGSSGASSGGTKSSGGASSSGGKSSSGGTTSTGGTNTGGTSSGGSGPTNPPGYWTQGSLHGCVWVDKDHNSAALVTVTPQDFTSKAAPPYCISGSVGGSADYSGIAMLSFNLAQPAPTSCAYNPDTATSNFPTVAVSGTGVAFTLTKNTTSPLRVMLYGSSPNQHWCSVVTATGGKVFAPFSSFNTECWSNEGTPYANQPLASIVFYVYGPGEGEAAVPFNFCVNGPAFGTSANAAP